MSTQIKLGSQVLSTFNSGTKTLQTTEKWLTNNVSVFSDGCGSPKEIATSAEMDAINTSANLGNIYKYTGITDTKYTNNRLYVVEQDVATPLCFTANTANSTTEYTSLRRVYKCQQN